MKNVPLPLAVALAVAALLLVGIVIWRSTNTSAPVNTGPHNLAQEYGMQRGAPPGPH
jgi:hypothetical protein